MPNSAFGLTDTNASTTAIKHGQVPAEHSLRKRRGAPSSGAVRDEPSFFDYAPSAASQTEKLSKQAASLEPRAGSPSIASTTPSSGDKGTKPAFGPWFFLPSPRVFFSAWRPAPTPEASAQGLATPTVCGPGPGQRLNRLSSSHEHMSGLLEHIDFTQSKVREARVLRSDIVEELRRNSSRLNLGLGGVMISLAMVLLAVGPFIPTPVGVVLLLVVVIGLTSPQGRGMLAQNFLGEQKLNETKQRLLHATQRLHFCEGWLKAAQTMKSQALLRPQLHEAPLALLLDQLNAQIRPEHELAQRCKTQANKEFELNQSATKLAGAAWLTTVLGVLSFRYVLDAFTGVGAVVMGGLYATGTWKKAAPTLMTMVRNQIEGPAQAQYDETLKRYDKWMACRRPIYADLVERRDAADSKIAAALAS